MTERRIDLDDAGNLDDLSISGSAISLLRLERMSDDTFWGAIYMQDGSTHILKIFAEAGHLIFILEDQ